MIHRRRLREVVHDPLFLRGREKLSDVEGEVEGGVEREVRSQRQY